jgi:transposase
LDYRPTIGLPDDLELLVVLEKIANQILSALTDFQRLRTIPGIDPINALVILAESGDLQRFCHYRQYLNFCGFNLSAVQSGQLQARHQLSKRDNV